MTPEQLAALFASVTAVSQAFAGQSAHWQAQIDNYLSGAVKAVYIDALVGNDLNSGTADAPVKTLTRALKIMPAGQQGVWYLSPNNAVFDFDEADAAPELRFRRLAIQPKAPPAGGANADPGNMPTIRFKPRPFGAGYCSTGFFGGGVVWIHYCNVESAAGVPGVTTFFPEGAFRGGLGGRDLDVTLSYSTLRLKEQTLISTLDGSQNRITLAYNRIFELGVGVQGKLYKASSGEPTILSAVGQVVPAGRTLKSMIEFPAGTPLDADGKPRALITNVLYT